MSKIRVNHLEAIARSTIASFPRLNLDAIIQEKLADLGPQEAFVDCTVLGEIIALPGEISGDPTINAQAFSRSDLLDFGLLGEIYLRAPSLFDALLLCEEYQFTRGDFVKLTVLDKGDTVVVRFDALGNQASFDSQLALQMSILRFMELAVGQEVKLLGLGFKDFSAAKFFTRLKRRFKHSITTTIGETILVLDREALKKQPSYYNEQIWQNLKTALSSSRQLYDTDNIGQSVVRSVNCYLSQGRRPTISLIASDLHTSKRNLQRVLREQGYSFSSELKTAVLEKAKYFLVDTNESLTSISEALGFSSQESFSRFFKSNTGIQPYAFRKAA